MNAKQARKEYNLLMLIWSCISEGSVRWRWYGNAKKNVIRQPGRVFSSEYVSAYYVADSMLADCYSYLNPNISVSQWIRNQDMIHHWYLDTSAGKKAANLSTDAAYNALTDLFRRTYDAKFIRDLTGSEFLEALTLTEEDQNILGFASIEQMRRRVLSPISGAVPFMSGFITPLRKREGLSPETLRAVSDAREVISAGGIPYVSLASVNMGRVRERMAELAEVFCGAGLIGDCKIPSRDEMRLAW